jgi:predicted  nucleic acid-binding Zn-ribbon protein
MEISQNLYITDLKELLFKYDELKKHNEILDKIDELEKKLDNKILSISNKVEMYKKEFENQVEKIYRKIRDVESEID